MDTGDKSAGIRPEMEIALDAVGLKPRLRPEINDA